jgi:hypothetical protein
LPVDDGFLCFDPKTSSGTVISAADDSRRKVGDQPTTLQHPSFSFVIPFIEKPVPVAQAKIMDCLVIFIFISASCAIVKFELEATLLVLFMSANRK